MLSAKPQLNLRSAREYYWALQEPQRNETLAQTAWQAWKDFERKFPQPAAYQVQCPMRLVQKLAEACNAQIARFLPGTARHETPLPTLAEALGANNGDDLRALIRCGMVILWTTPDDFLAWRDKSFVPTGLL